MKAALLVVKTQVPIFCGPKDGGRYDLSDACPVCGTGARRIDPITLPLGKLKDCIAITLKHEVIIPPKLVAALKSTTPQCIREIRDEKTGVASAFAQLVPELTMPRWGVSTTGWTTSKMIPPCLTCKRDGFYNVPKIPLKVTYDCSIPSFSVAETFERFGRSCLQANFRDSTFAVSYLVVSEAVGAVLRGEPGVELIPISCSS